MKVNLCVSLLFICTLGNNFLFPNFSFASEPLSPSTKYWNVDDIRAGMRGKGKTVIKGTHIQEFDAVVLGVLKNTSPGRDLILFRLSGLNLEQTGVIAGMSGSPVYIQGKLVGAVAYAWPFGKEPIAGITPFGQMERYAQIMEKGDKEEPVRQVRLPRTIDVAGKSIKNVTVSDSFSNPHPTSGEGMFLMPLRTPLAATGFTPQSLSLLREKLQSHGMVPMQGGGVSSQVAKKEMATTLKPGGALTVALVMGDFDLSGIGTVTHIEGKRVYGWGHPFMGLGACDFPMMTGYTHIIYPRQNLSFKMGSPLKTVGVINADVSTCIAGFLGKEPDMVPVKMTVCRESLENAKTFQVKIVRQPSLFPTLVFTSLTNSVDMEGELPEEMTAYFKAKIEMDGHDPIIIEDAFSGVIYSGGRAPRSLYNLVSDVLSRLLFNSHEALRIKSIECTTLIKKGRKIAEIEAIELDSDEYQPGETVKAAVFLRPHKGGRQRIHVELKLPRDLAEGDYKLKFCNGTSHAHRVFQDTPALSNPQNLEQTLQGLKLKTSAKRTHLVMRLPVDAVGVSLNGKTLPNLPPSMVQIFSDGRQTGAQTVSGAMVSEKVTE